MHPILAATGVHPTRDWLVDTPLIIATTAVIVVGLWVAMLVAAYRRTR